MKIGWVEGHVAAVAMVGVYRLHQERLQKAEGQYRKLSHQFEDEAEKVAKELIRKGFGCTHVQTYPDHAHVTIRVAVYYDASPSIRKKAGEQAYALRELKQLQEECGALVGEQLTPRHKEAMERLLANPKSKAILMKALKEAGL